MVREYNPHHPQSWGAFEFKAETENLANMKITNPCLIQTWSVPLFTTGHTVQSCDGEALKKT